jgi:predicted acylesterase/phospholipase RssA
VETEYDATAEVRFAVVLYGGVSLAIYMNGIVQELFELVRATAPAGDDGKGLHVPDEELQGAGTVYRRLGTLLQDGKITGSPDGKVRTRFVVDIITGTSAGGINGVFLGKALANAQSISPLSKLWIEQGDIGKLLNDGLVGADNPAVKPQRPPLSVLSGERMLYQLLRAVDDVSEENLVPSTSPYADAIDLWVTTTDLEGRNETIATADQRRLGVVEETNYRKTFHFLYDRGPDTDPGINLFERKWDPMLAFAARCTSSFPGAFQAVQLTDLADVEAGVSKEEARRVRNWASIEDNVHQFFPEYGEQATTTESRSFADGGYLDNQPVDLVMSTLPKRRAELPVARRILIVDPDPGADVATVDDVHPRADLVETIVKVGTLPRVQTIGGEVDRILDLREPLDARRRIYDAVDRALDDAEPSTNGGAVPTPVPVSPGAPSGAFVVSADSPGIVQIKAGDGTEADAELPSTRGRTIADIAYRSLRVARTASDIGETLARVAFSDRQYETGTQQQWFATRLVEAWLNPTDEPTDGDREEWFLERWDLSYWLRRINFVHGRAGAYIVNSKPGKDPDSLRTARRKLDLVYTDLANSARKLRRRDDVPDSVGRLRTSLGTVDVSADDDLKGDGYQRQRAALESVLEDFARTVPLDSVNGQIVDAIDGDDDLLRSNARFDDYDQATLAVRDLVPGENDDIKVIRVSPRDTTMLVDEQRSGPKLAGSRIHHFGAFFDDDWRRRDILWGRLDAAERLICALWPAPQDETPSAAGPRDELIRQAQRGIVRDVLGDSRYRTLLGLSGPPTDATVTEADIDSALQFLQKNEPAASPDSRDSLRLAARAARVVDAVGTGLARPNSPVAVPTKWVGRALRLGASLIEVALPDRLRSIVTRHLLDVAIIAAILMILLGGLFGGAGVVSFGWTVLLVVVGLKIVIELLRLWFAHGKWMILAVAVAAVVVGLAVYGVASSEGWAHTVGLVTIGVGVGLGIATTIGIRRKKPGAKPVVTGGLALLLVLVLGGFGAAHARTSAAHWACDRHGNLRAPLTRIVLASCNSSEPATTHHARQ